MTYGEGGGGLRAGIIPAVALRRVDGPGWRTSGMTALGGTAAVVAAGAGISGAVRPHQVVLLVLAFLLSAVLAGVQAASASSKTPAVSRYSPILPGRRQVLGRNWTGAPLKKACGDYAERNDKCTERCIALCD